MGDATAQELHLARVTRQQAMEALENAAALGLELHVPDQLRQQQERIRQREQQEALALQEEARPAMPPPPLPPPPPPPQILTAVPPSIEDLFSLWRVCGGSEAHVVETLARLWGTAPGDIAETVRTWLAPMPPIKLPSRSHSAPPVLPLEVRERLKSAGPSAFPAIRQPWERRAAVRRAARQYDDQGAPINPLALNSLAAARGLRGGPTRASTFSSLLLDSSFSFSVLCSFSLSLPVESASVAAFTSSIKAILPKSICLSWFNLSWFNLSPV